MNNKLFASLLVAVLLLFLCAAVVPQASTPDEIIDSEQDLRTAVSSNAPDDTEYVIALSRDIELTGESLDIPRDKIITLVSGAGAAPYRLVGANGRDTISISANGALTIDGIIVTHQSGDSGRGVTVNQSASLILRSGEISNNSLPSGDGGGVYMRGNTLIIEGGKISGNTVGGNGGGIYFTTSGAGGDGEIEIKNGAVISGNTAGGNGGGIWIPGSHLGRVTVAAGVTFADNKASKAYDRFSDDDETYYKSIGDNGQGVSWTTPFTQGYNNYDIGYIGDPYVWDEKPPVEEEKTPPPAIKTDRKPIQPPEVKPPEEPLEEEPEEEPEITEEAPREAPKKNEPAATVDTEDSPAPFNTEAILTYNQGLTPDEVLGLLKDDGVPIMSLGGQEVPMFSGSGLPVWAPINLILALVGAVMAVSAVLRARKGRKTGADEANRWIFPAAVFGALGPILFLLTENTNNLIVLADNWTVLNAAIFAAVVICSKLAFQRKAIDRTPL